MVAESKEIEFSLPRAEWYGKSSEEVSLAVAKFISSNFGPGPWSIKFNPGQASQDGTSRSFYATYKECKQVRIILKSTERKDDNYLLARLVGMGIFATSVKIVEETPIEGGSVEITVEYD